MSNLQVEVPNTTFPNTLHIISDHNEYSFLLDQELEDYPNICIYKTDSAIRSRSLLLKKHRNGSQEHRFFLTQPMATIESTPQFNDLFIRHVYQKPNFLGFPLVGSDILSFTLKHTDFWIKNKDVTTKVVTQLSRKLLLFHTSYKAMLNDIKPENIIIRSSDFACFFIDFEHFCKGPEEPTYRTISTMGYMSFQKLVAHISPNVEYNMCTNDNYALGVTFYNMITTNESPSLDVSIFRTADGHMSRSLWIHAHNQAISNVDAVLTQQHGWDKQSKTKFTKMLSNIFMDFR